MSAAEIDDYLEHLEQPKRSTLSQLRRDILAVVPHAEQCISYAVPGFKVDGKVVAGSAAFKNHVSYLPHSGSVFPELAEELSGYQKSSGALRFPSTSGSPERWSRSSSPYGWPRRFRRAERPLISPSSSRSSSSCSSYLGPSSDRCGSSSTPPCRCTSSSGCPGIQMRHLPPSTVDR